jgi:hypothetical protein
MASTVLAMTARSRTTLCIIIGLAALTLVGCSSTPYAAPEAPSPDAAVAAMLPTGAYTVSGQLTLKSGAATKLEGFVDFGTAPDGAACEADSTITDIRADATQSPIREVREMHTAGGPTWFQDRSDPAAPGEWVDIADPAAPGVLLLFVPAIIASDYSPGMLEGAGTGNLCSIGTMARFMTVDGDQLVFDVDRTEAAVTAVRGRWVEQFVDALGLRGSRASTIATKLAEISTPTYGTLIRDTTIVIERIEDEGFTLTQIREGTPMVELRFTRAEDRVVETVGGLTYFERVAAKVEKDGVESALEEFVG